MAEKIINRTVIPALPGWYVAMLIKGGTDGTETWPDRLSLDPIIAWEIERTESEYHPSAGRHRMDRAIYHHVIPLTLDGNLETHGNPWCVKTPEGKFEIQGVATHSTEEGAIKELKG